MEKPIIEGKTPGVKLDRERITVVTLKEMKKRNALVAALSIYDFPFAQYADQAGIDVIIVGDSLRMTLLGYKNTLPVTMDQMISHASAVRRGTDRIFVVGDMPFMSYQASDEEAVRNAGRFISEAGCEAVKCEASKKLLARIKAIANAEILVMGHIGLNPHKIHEMGGYRIQGKTRESTIELLETAYALQNAGVFALLLEGVTEEVAQIISENLEIPVYGIGSGRYLDGQLLIGHDPMGMYSGFKKMPIYIKQYRVTEKDIGKTPGDVIRGKMTEYVDEVKERTFPGEKNVHKVRADEFDAIKEELIGLGLVKRANLLV